MSWRQFDVHMEELKTVLRQNHDNLNEWDRALRRDECVVEDVVSSVKNIDKNWPDKQYNLMKVLFIKYDTFLRIDGNRESWESRSIRP